MRERVPVRCVLVIGDQAEIAADTPDATAPERYPAATVAEQAGLYVEELPGSRLTAEVGPDGRLQGFRRR